MSNIINLNQQELAAVIRLIDPDRNYLGDAPELWFKDVQLKIIRHKISETFPHIPYRASRT